METIKIIIINSILILFPFFCYFFYRIYCKNINFKNSNIFLSLTLLISFYLNIKFSLHLSVMSFNVLLLISYLKNKKITAIILSSLFIVYYTHYFNLNVFYLIMEYLIYYVLYIITKDKFYFRSLMFSIFIIIKGISLIYIVHNVLFNNLWWLYNVAIVITGLILFYFLTNIILLILEQGRRIVNLNNSLQELEKEKIKKESLFKITHEIKNSIAVIKGYLDIIDIKNCQKFERYLPIIKSEVNRTLTIMDDFLDCTRIKVDKDIIDIYMLLEEVVKVISQLVNYHDIILEANIPDDELFIVADYERLKQVMINILKNSIEAKDDNKIMKIQINTKTKENKIIVEIFDNGIGMDEKVLNNCGEMFYSTKKNGTGLGINLSKEIIKLHQGNIKYESMKGSYTKVSIVLPIEEKFKTA